MECRLLDITLNSAEGLKDLNRVSKMDLYAVVSIHGDDLKQKQQQTPIDKGCGPNPEWNFSMKFTVDVSAARKNRLELLVEIKANKKLVGEVKVPIKGLLESCSKESQEERHASYIVQTRSGRDKGVLNFTYKFGETFTDTRPRPPMHPMMFFVV